MYIAIGCVIYYYCGSHVASPALGSAGVVIKKVAYGIALLGLLVSTTIVLHVSEMTSQLERFIVKACASAGSIGSSRASSSLSVSSAALVI